MCVITYTKQQIIAEVLASTGPLYVLAFGVRTTGS